MLGGRGCCPSVIVDFINLETLASHIVSNIVTDGQTDVQNFTVVQLQRLMLLLRVRRHIKINKQ